MDHDFSPDGFAVVFTDDFGQLFRIEGAPLGAAALRESDRCKKALTAAFEQFSLPAFRKAVPTARAERQGYLAEVCGGALLYRVELPGGSNLQVQEDDGPPHRLDSTRAVVLFVQNGNLVQVSTQVMVLPGGLRPAAELWEETKGGAIQFAKSISFGGA